MLAGFWRIAHFLLAAVASLFLIVAAVTGAILGGDAAFQKLNASGNFDLDKISVAQTVSVLKQKYPEISEIHVDENRNVNISAFDENGEEINAAVNPETGEVLKQKKQESPFIQQVKTLHRSLFLHEAGRFLVGVVSVLLLFIVVSGTVLIIKRQKTFRNFFGTVHRDFLPQFLHVVFGRVFLLPLFITALTGSLLFMNRFKLLPKPAPQKENFQAKENGEKQDLQNFSIFAQTKISEVEKLEFPFSDEPDEFFKLKLKDREITINQETGAVISEKQNSKNNGLADLSLDIHTGRTNWLWALILTFSSVSVLVFIWSGFAIAFRRFKAKLKNKFKPNEAEFIILFGSENGTTAAFADKIHRQILADHRKSYIAPMNDFQNFPNAKFLLVFTSTYGLGDAPANASHFIYLIKKIPQKNKINFSVVGFGSKSYSDFCAFGKEVDRVLSEQEWGERFTTFYSVNDRSTTEFTEWVEDWEEKSQVPLVSAPAFYEEKKPPLKSLKLVEKNFIDEQQTTLLLKFKTSADFRSGDLLAIYPGTAGQERFYSMGKVNGFVQLLVKIHENGLGSNYFLNLKINEIIRAKIIQNSDFHFNKKTSPYLLISNGTGIAPFLGMVDENKSEKVELFAGFRYGNFVTKNLQDNFNLNKNSGKLSDLYLAFSREENPKYVMDLIKENPDKIMDIFSNSGTIMICGSLAMLRDVENVLSEICENSLNTSLDYFRKNGQIKTDCY